MALPSYVTQVLLDRPSGLWLLADAVGASSAVDSNPCLGGPRTSGTPTGVTFGVGGPLPGLSAASFNGSSSAITLVPSIPIVVGSTWTLEALIKPLSASPASLEAIFDFGRTDTPGNGFLMFQTNNTYAVTGTIQVERWVNGGAPSAINGPSPLSTTSWTHVVATYDGARLHLFLNDVEVASQTDSTVWIASKPHLGLGSNESANSWFFGGSMAANAIYQYALTAQQIANHYNAWQAAAKDYYVPIASGVQPPSVPGIRGGISAWTGEVYAGGGIGTPPSVGQLIVAGVQIGTQSYKYWMLDSQVVAKSGV